MKNPIVMDEGDLAYSRWTIRILAGFCVMLGLISGVSILQVDRLAHQVKELQQENEDLKNKLSLHELNLGDSQRTLDAVTNMIVKLGKKTPQEAERLAILEVVSAEKHGVDLPTGLAVSFQESKWKTSVVSIDGSSIGIKQINLGAWQDRFKGMTASKLINPKYNIDVGYTLLAKHIKDYGTINRALQRYRGSRNQDVNVQYADDVQKTAQAIRKHLTFSQT